MKQASEQTESIDSDGVQIEDLGSDTDDSSEDFDDLDLDEGDLLNLDAVQRMVEDMTWKLVQINAPDWYLNFELQSSVQHTLRIRQHSRMLTSSIPTRHARRSHLL
jgi:hypothetical protein